MGRVGAAIAVLAAPLAVSQAASAAGTLGSPTWTVMDPRTNIVGNRYDYGFTTATAGTVSRVSATVPAGTTGANRYLAFNGVNGNTVSTPNSAANSITGNIDFRAKFSAPTWPSGGYTILANKQSSNSSRDYEFYLDGSGNLILTTSPDGTTWVSAISSVKPTVTANTPIWVRATRLVDNGASGNTTSFYTSTDGTTWTLLSTMVNSGTTSIRTGSTNNIDVGGITNYSQMFNGKIYYMDIRNGITQTTIDSTHVGTSSLCSGTGVVQCLDPNNDSVGGTSWASSGATGETWTVNRSGTNLPTDVVSDLSVMNVSGVTAGGSAQLREIDSTAVYKLPTATPIGATIPVKLALAGMTNTYTAGSPTSTISTVDAAGTAIDTGATAAVAMTGPVSSVAGGLVTTYPTATTGTSIGLSGVGIAVSGNTLYATDAYSSSVLALDTTTGKATTFAGNGATSIGTYGGSPTATALWTPESVSTDSSGNVYISNTGQSNIVKVSGGVISQYAGVGATAGQNGDGTATTHYLYSPRGTTFDSAGNLYIADRTNNQIRKVDTSGNMTTIAGTGVKGFSGDGGAATSAKLSLPYDVAVASNGDIYISDYGNARIRKIDHTTLNISTVAGTGTAGFSGDGSAATTAQVSNPSGLALDGSGNIYFADQGNYRVRKITAGGIISTVAGTGTYGYAGDGGTATAATLGAPRGLALDASGNLYVATFASVRRIDTSGNISTVLGTGSNPGYAGDGGPIVNARFFSPNQVWSAASGDIYVADSANAVIRKVSQYGQVSTVAGMGDRPTAYTGDGGAATSATMSNPTGVAVAPSGDIYIADANNNAIRKVSGGTITTFASGSGLSRLGFDASGNLYSSTSCQVLKYVLPSTTPVVIAGTTTCGVSGDGAAATAAQLNGPREMIFDNSGNLYIGDSNNGRVRRVDTNGIITTVAGGGVSTGSNIAATSANLGSVRGLAIDGIGNFYVDTFGAVKRFTIGGPLVSLNSVGGGGGMGVMNGTFYVSNYNNHNIYKLADASPMAPLVNSDAMTVPMNTTRQWPILSNDWSRMGEMDPSSVTIATQPAHGTVSISNPTTEAKTLQAVFVPTTAYTGSDSFTYNACDTTRVQCATATVNVTISSNGVTTVVGGLTEGYATDIGFIANGVTQYKNYLLISDSQNNVIRRYDQYSKQLVVIAGTGAGITTSATGVANAIPVLNSPATVVAPDGTITFVEPANNWIRQISTAGVTSTVIGTGTSGNSADGTTATAAQVLSPGYIAQGPDGAIYFNSGQWIRKATVGGTLSTVVGTGVAGNVIGGTPTTTQINNPGGMAFTTAGDLIFLERSNCVVRQLSGSAMSIIAGTLSACGTTVDGTIATSAKFQGPSSLAIDTTGGILVNDNVNNRVVRFMIGGTLSATATSGSSYSSGVTATNYSLVAIGGIAANSAGGYFVTATGPHVLVSINGYSTSSIVTQIAGNVAGNNLTVSYAGDGNVGYQTQIGTGSGGGGVAVDSGGSVYFNDIKANRIRKLDAATGLVSTYAGDGSSLLNAPSGQLAFGPNGQLATFDSFCNIRIRDTGGALTTIAGTSTCTYGGDGGLATAASFGSSGGLTYNSAGDLYVAASTDSRVRRIDHTTGIITTIAGTGTAGSTGDGGAATAATLNSPNSLQFDNAGNLFIVESGNSSVRMVDSSGTITTVATSLAGVRGISKDAVGNIYVSTISCNQFFRLNSNTTTIVAGTCAYGLTDNTTTGSGVFYAPSGIAISGADMYVYDASNNRIRKISGVTSTTSSTVASTRWTVVPASTGHANVRERLSLLPASVTTSSKLTMTAPSTFAATPSVVEAYGLTGTVTASLSGTTITVSYPSQSLAAGVPIAIGIEGITNVGAIGNLSSFVQLYDSAGTTVVGTIQSNVVKQSATTGPSASEPGFGSLWKRSLSTTVSAVPTVAVSPAGITDATSAFTLTNAGSINSNTTTLSATAMVVSPYSLSPITTDTTTSVAAASFTMNRWGVQLASSTGVNAGATGSGLYSGLSTAQANVITGAGAANVSTITARAKINYLQPAGTYKSTFVWRFAGGI